ncbi:MAG: hypothetical protein RIQ60_3544 [Pseudomonadota bacterium]|jgi:hypothetical protein
MATSYLIAFWNLENFFAPEGYPGREPWLATAMRSDLSGWTAELFDRKASQLASIVAQMKGGLGPDLLGVCEAENRYVLHCLADKLNALRPARDYQLVHVDSAHDQRGIDTAFIVDAKVLTPNPAEIFTHWVVQRTGTRDILQCTFTTRAGNELVALANHWPSRSGGPGEGPEYSQGFRCTAGETLGYWHDRIREVKGVNAAILAMGDFNDQPFDPSLARHAVAGRERGDVMRAQSAKFYNLGWKLFNQQVVDHRGKPREIDGTLYFGGDAWVFDQILVARGLLAGPGKLRVNEASARIEAYAEMVDHRVSDGAIRFGLPKGDAAANTNPAGFSDHFPVSVLVEEL